MNPDITRSTLDHWTLRFTVLIIGLQTGWAVMAVHPVWLASKAPPRLLPASITQSHITIDAARLAALMANPKVVLPKGAVILDGGWLAAFTEGPPTFEAFMPIGSSARFTFNAFQTIFTGPAGFG